MAIDYRVRPFTCDEYFKLVEVGILAEDDPVELLDGEILLMPPVGDDHSSVVMRMTRFLVIRLDGAAMVLPQSTIRLSNVSAPEPDFAILRPKDDFYRSGHARPHDILALVEVSDSSLRYDRGRKLNAYARARIPEYWIANLVDWTLVRHREPSDLGYGEVVTLRNGDAVELAAISGVAFPIDDLLGPRYL